MMGNEKDYLATRVSYKLDLRGPALNIQTACSTSLVAVVHRGPEPAQLPVRHGARRRRLDHAAAAARVPLPGGRDHVARRSLPARSTRDAAGHRVQQRRRDRRARRLSEALADGDTIYAVIKGAAINNDGAAKVSFTAPSVDGHAGVIALAQALAGIDPATISYVEAHGTATPLGDPIEIAGLTQAFRAGGASGHRLLRDRIGQEQRRPSRRRRRASPA